MRFYKNIYGGGKIQISTKSYVSFYPKIYFYSEFEKSEDGTS